MPLVIGGPGLPFGLEVNGQVRLVDIVPPVLDLLGVGEEDEHAGRRKVIREIDTDTVELYDLRSGPNEQQGHTVSCSSAVPRDSAGTRWAVRLRPSRPEAWCRAVFRRRLIWTTR
ncbi:hypothetical protein [[Kitasatospora] papulosa]|uniref:hypothetical protein n=1 Tax=[Kitasatospora] papulosa TaxID=1464011 RepID=UPI0036AF922C